MTYTSGYVIVLVQYVLDYRVNLNPQGVYFLLSESSPPGLSHLTVWMFDARSLSVLFH